MSQLQRPEGRYLAPRVQGSQKLPGPPPRRGDWLRHGSQLREPHPGPGSCSCYNFHNRAIAATAWVNEGLDDTRPKSKNRRAKRDEER